MRRFLLVLFILFSSQIIFGQIKVVVVDSLSKEPIPYLSVWVEGSQSSFITDKDGLLNFPANFIGQTHFLTAPGFKGKKIYFKQITNVIELSQKIFELDEIVVTARTKKRKYKKANKIQKSKVGHYLSGFKERKIFAEFFKYESEYEKTPYLKEVRILTKSEIQDAKFNIILFSLNDNGEPDGYIYPKKIVATAKLGKQTTKINLNHLSIPFPKKGFFIGLEWFTTNGMNEWGAIQPNIGFMQLESEIGSWYYRYGKWEKIWQNSGKFKHYKDKYNHLAIELVLSN